MALSGHGVCMLTAAWEARLRRRPLRLRRRRWCHERTPDATELPGGVEPLPEEVELVRVAPCERVHLCVRIFAVPRASGSVRVTGDPSVLDRLSHHTRSPAQGVWIVGHVRE